MYEDLWLEKAKKFKESSKKVWDGNYGKFYSSKDLTLEEIARFLKEESLWEAYNDDPDLAF